MTSKTTNKFSPEVRERAVRMVREFGSCTNPLAREEFWLGAYR